MDDRLFDVPDPDPVPVKLSPGAHRTERQRRALANGIHPAMGGPIGEGTCGTCAHLQSFRGYSRSKTYHKCPKTKLGISHSEASDIRASWPGCHIWKEAT